MAWRFSGHLPRTKTFWSIENLHASVGDDRLVGNSANNEFRPGYGDDYINGSSGVDTLVFERDSNVSVDLSKSTAQNTGQGYDTILKIENVSGSDGDDVIIGNATNNTFVIWAGKDTLAGNGGSDTFNLTNASGQKTFLDFSDDDQIEIGEFTVSSSTYTAALQTHTFVLESVSEGVQRELELVFENQSSTLEFLFEI